MHTLKVDYSVGPPLTQTINLDGTSALFGVIEYVQKGVKILVAWNVEFDRRLLHQTAKRHDLTLPVRPWHCAMEAETTTRGPDAPYAKLAEAARRLGVSASGAHSALGDARATLAVVRALVGDVPA